MKSARDDISEARSKLDEDARVAGNADLQANKAQIIADINAKIDQKL